MVGDFVRENDDGEEYTELTRGGGRGSSHLQELDLVAQPRVRYQAVSNEEYDQP